LILNVIAGICVHILSPCGHCQPFSCRLQSQNCDLIVVKNVKRTFVVPHTQPIQACITITQFYLQITPCLPLPRKHSADGTSTD